MNKPTKFRKKPVVIDAVQWDGTEAHSKHIIGWITHEGGDGRYIEEVPPKMHSVYCRCDGRGIIPGPKSCPETEPWGPTEPAHIAIDTLEGTMKAPKNSWVIRGLVGEFYACDPDVFEKSYEPDDG